MGVSLLQEQRDIIIGTLKDITRGDWKVLVVDEDSKKILDNAVDDDDILNENIASIDSIEHKRPPNPEMDAIYILTPAPHIVDCVMADLERKRYRRAFIIWTSVLDTESRRRITSSPQNQAMIAHMRTLTISFFPREQRLVTFRDPDSFPILYHPACNNLVADHMQMLAQRIAGVCISLGEYPLVRYYRPRAATHEASVLCTHLARFVQQELDTYAKFNEGFPPPSPRPQGVLIITDRSMDLVAPLMHEFTYQAMAHDLLPIKESDKTTYKTVLNSGTAEEEEKEIEINEEDEIWVKNRHEHMKDTIERIMADFNKFIADHPHFMDTENKASLNAIKDMLAGLPQFTALKERYSLHLSMAQECMNVFARFKLPDVASLEQTLATGLDDEYRKPKNVADQLVRLLDDEAVAGADRLRLIMLYILFKSGIVSEDIPRLLAHAHLPPHSIDAISNLSLLGATPTRALKEVRQPPPPLFAQRAAPNANAEEEYSLSRFEPALKHLLDNLASGSLDAQTFPYVRPPLDAENPAQLNSSSLRSAKPTWAQNRRSTNEARQRVVIFMAGGATYSEARVAYEQSKGGRDCVLVTSHMLNPGTFVRQIEDLSQDRRRLKLKVDEPKRKPPQWVFEREAPPPPKPQPQPQQSRLAPQGQVQRPGDSQRPGTGHDLAGRMGGMSLNGGGGSGGGSGSGGSKLEKKSKPEKEEKEKKKRGFFGLKDKR